MRGVPPPPRRSREIKAVKMTCGHCGAGVEVPVGTAEPGVRRCFVCGKALDLAVLGAWQDFLEGLARLKEEQNDRLTVTLKIE